MYRKQVRRRRAVLVALIVLSLILLSSQFSEAQSGPLHTIQRGIATVFAPVGEVAGRALKPVRDMINWFDETFDARGQNDELRSQVADLRQQVTELQGAAGDNEQFQKLLDIDRTAALGQYTPVTSRVIGRSPTVWFSDITVDHGSSSGIKRNDAVVNGDGLVGRVTDLTAGTAQVELITDHNNAVSAQVLPNGPQGVVEPEVGDPEDLSRLHPQSEPCGERFACDRRLVERQVLLGLPAGNPDRPRDLRRRRRPGAFQRIHVTPYANLRDLEYVQVLTGGPDRPAVPDDRHQADRDPHRADPDPHRDPSGLVLLLPLDPRRGPERAAGCDRLAGVDRRRRRRGGLRLCRRLPARLGAPADARRLLARPALRLPGRSLPRGARITNRASRRCSRAG